MASRLIVSLAKYGRLAMDLVSRGGRDLVSVGGRTNPRFLTWEEAHERLHVRYPFWNPLQYQRMVDRANVAAEIGILMETFRRESTEISDLKEKSDLEVSEWARIHKHHPGHQAVHKERRAAECKDLDSEEFFRLEAIAWSFLKNGYKNLSLYNIIPADKVGFVFSDDAGTDFQYANSILELFFQMNIERGPWIIKMNVPEPVMNYFDQLEAIQVAACLPSIVEQVNVIAGKSGRFCLDQAVAKLPFALIIQGNKSDQTLQEWREKGHFEADGYVEHKRSVRLHNILAHCLKQLD